MVIMIMIYFTITSFFKNHKKINFEKKIVCIFPKGWKEHIDIDEVYKKN